MTILTHSDYHWWCDRITNEVRRTPNPLVSDLSSRNLAYIIYTSGSTGKPKGVLIEHQGAVNLLYGRPEMFGISSSSRVLQFTSLSFDHSVSEIYSALTGGASLHMIREDTRLDRNALWQYMSTRSITHVSLTPSLLQDTKGLPVLTTPLTFVIMGELLTAATISQVYKVVPNGRIINEYGPTEASVATTVWDCPHDFHGDVVPLGRPIPNKTVYILDKYLQPVPLGATGEMFIGGVGVARGYLNRSELTAQLFLPDPFTDEPGARMYKTGDLARFLPDGNIVYLGRNDHQVKIRGFRVELGEIETRLSEHPLVDKSIVLGLGEGNNKRLVAYVAAPVGDDLVHILRSYLTSCLPDYMVPAAIVRMDSLPLNSNGKIDRKALPDPDSSAFAREDYEEPQGMEEIAVAQIWSELLHIDKISRNDNFFALGGHSLLAVQLIERLRRVGLSIPVRDLFKNPTLRVLVQSMSRHEITAAPSNLITPDTTKITPNMLPLISLTQTDIDHVINHVPGGVSNIQDIYALSPLQEGILFHHLLEAKGDPYLRISFMVFSSRHSLDQYLETFQRVVDRHDILRTGIVWENMSTPAQVVWRRAPLSIMELQLDPADGPIKNQLMTRLDPRVHRIDVSQAPLWTFTIAKDGDDRWVVAQLVHHLISDHSTLDVLLREIRAFNTGQGDTLPSPQPFRNLIAQVRSGKSQSDHERFFTEMLGDIDAPSLPFGLSDVLRHSGNVTSSYRDLPQDLNDRLRRHAKHLGVTLASLCHLAWGMVISRTCGEERVVFGTVLFGRMNSGQGSDSAMGVFINTLPLRVDIQGTVRESVQQTHERLASLLDHEHASLALAQTCSNVPKGTPLFSSMLNYRHYTVKSDKTPIHTGIEHVESFENDNYPLSLSVEDYGTSLGITVDIVSPLDSTRICGYMQQALQSLAEAIDHTLDIDVHKLDIVPIEERRLLTHTWNARYTQDDYSAQLCMHHLFEQQVERTPEATAVFMDQSLSYAELNEKANRLAHHLIGLGVRPDAPVAISVDRSPAMIVGVLGVLKAGGAYVPLDPAYASDRLKAILADVAPSVVIADESGRVALGEALSSMTVLDLDVIATGHSGNSEYVFIGLLDWRDKYVLRVRAGYSNK
jgi:amino acid adenylation domain-containing protein